MRADAQRNRDALVAAARVAFAERGADAPLDDIARSAKVGPGTLYRHFPNRDALLAAVYAADIEEIGAEAHRLAETLPPDEAFTTFLHVLLDYSRRKLGLHRCIKQMLATHGDTFERCRAIMLEGIGAVLGGAQSAGLVRSDIEPWTLVRLVHGVAVASETAPETADMMLAVVHDGLRVQVPVAAESLSAAGSGRSDR